MRQYTVNKIKHTVYDDISEVPNHIQVIEDWRNGEVGCWVLADDGCVLQVLRQGTMLRHNGQRKYIGTCTGTFIALQKNKMDGDRRPNIYSFGGYDTPEEVVQNRKQLTSNEELFVQYLSQGLTPEDAYIKAFPTNNRQYARGKSVQLIKTERVKTAVKEELKPILEELNISESYVLNGIKQEADNAEKPDVRLKALFKLSDILDLEDKTKTNVQAISGAVFQGFSNEEIDVAKPKEIK